MSSEPDPPAEGRGGWGGREVAEGDLHPAWDCQDRVSQTDYTAQSDAHSLVQGPVCVEPGPFR